MAGNESDIRLRFGVEGGASIDAGSGKQIKDDLDAIIQKINKNPLEIKVSVSNDSVKDIKKQISDIAKKSASGKKSGSSGTTTTASDEVKILAKNTVEYNKALSRISTQITKFRENGVAIWTAASEGASKEAYNSLIRQIEAFERIEASVRSGAMTVEDFNLQISETELAAKKAVEAIKAVGENRALKIEAVEPPKVPDIKEYYAQLSKVDSLLLKTKKSLNDWSASKTGKSSDSYRGLEETVRVLEEMRDELLTAGVAIDGFGDRFAKASSDAERLSTDIKLVGENAKSTKSKLADIAKTLGVSFSIADVFHKAIEIGRKMVDTVTEIDTAMTELKKVTDETDATYERFLSNAEPRARALGATVADVVSASADFARLGHPLPDASDLADAAIVYKNVGDGIEDISTASESIISTMQAFGIEARNAMAIVDSFNAVGNNFAVSSKGIGDALLNSAASLSAAGNNIHESIALIAAANTTIQDPGKVGKFVPNNAVMH